MSLLEQRPHIMMVATDFNAIGIGHTVRTRQRARANTFRPSQNETRFRPFSTHFARRFAEFDHALLAAQRRDHDEAQPLQNTRKRQRNIAIEIDTGSGNHHRCRKVEQLRHALTIIPVMKDNGVTFRQTRAHQPTPSPARDICSAKLITKVGCKKHNTRHARFAGSDRREQHRL